MARRREMNKKKENGRLVEKMSGDYKSRYSGDLSPESEIVEKPYKATYKSRYK